MGQAYPNVSEYTTYLLGVGSKFRCNYYSHSIDISSACRDICNAIATTTTDEEVEFLYSNLVPKTQLDSILQSTLRKVFDNGERYDYRMMLETLYGDRDRTENYDRNMSWTPLRTLAHVMLFSSDYAAFVDFVCTYTYPFVFKPLSSPHTSLESLAYSQSVLGNIQLMAGLPCKLKRGRFLPHVEPRGFSELRELEPISLDKLPTDDLEAIYKHVVNKMDRPCKLGTWQRDACDGFTVEVLLLGYYGSKTQSMLKKVLPVLKRRVLESCEQTAFMKRHSDLIPFLYVSKVELLTPLICQVTVQFKGNTDYGKYTL